MKKIIHYIGLDVHKNSIAVGEKRELRSYVSRRMFKFNTGLRRVW